MQSNTVIDLSVIRDIVWHVSVQEIVPFLGQKLLPTDVEIKADQTPVTKIDKAAQRLLAELLSDAYPQAKIVGEEGFTSQDVRQAILDRSNRWVFVSDPVDGTSNLRDGKPNVGSMLHLFDKGRVAATWLCHPGSGDIVEADRRAGTVTLHNKIRGFETRLRAVSLDDKVDELNVVCGRKLIDALQKAAGEMVVAGRPVILKSKSPASGNYMRYLMPVAPIKDMTLFGEDICRARNIGHISYPSAPLHDHAGGQMMLALLGGVNSDYVKKHYNPLQRPGRGLITAIHPNLLRLFRKEFGPTLRALLRQAHP